MSISPAEGASDQLARSLTERITGQIREMLVTGELQPGKPIRARVLKDRFAVSHIPIREALHTLEGEGLVHYVPQRGAVATEVSGDELREIYELRRLIECRVAELSAPNYDADHVVQLEAALLQLESAHTEDRHGQAFFEAHDAFHWLLLQPFGDSYTRRVVQLLWSASRRYVHLSISSRPGSHAEHHRMLFAAAKDRDGDRVSQLLDVHLRITEDSLRLPPAAEAALSRKPRSKSSSGVLG